jgi:hypothetical protein
MTDTEELIKAALAKGADRAPHPGQIINALNTPRRRGRPALLAIVGAVVVIAAITIPIAFRTPAVNTPAPPATQYTPAPAPRTILMKYKPTYIPAGFVERSRDADIDGGEQIRNWMNSNDWAFHLMVYTPRSPRWPEMILPGRTPAEIGGLPGLPGWIDGSGKLAEVWWQPDKETVIKVQVYGPPDAREQAKAIAPSVVPDGVAFIRPPMSFGTLPDKLNRVAVEVYGSSPATGQTWLRASINGSNTRYIRARVAPKGTARLNGWNVVVPTPDGREIELVYNSGSTLTEAHALAIAQAIKVEAEPDFSWVGR